MRKAGQIIGLRVLALDTGREIAHVRDVLFDPENNRMLALLVDRGGWFSSAKVIPYDRVQSLGRDAVVVPHEEVVLVADADPRVKQALDSHKVVSGMQVYTSDGRYLGRIAEMLIDELTGEVRGYEVSGGMMEETLRGKKFLPAPETMEVGRHVVIVPPEAGARLEEQVTGGIQRMAEDTRDRVQETADDARTRVQETADDARVRMQEAAEGAMVRAEEAKVRMQETAEDARLRMQETAEDARGRMQETADDARVRAEEAGLRMQETAGETRSRVQGAAEEARFRGEEAFNRVRAQMIQASAEQQKRFVVGKRAETTVRTADGRVIVQQGETIGPLQAEEAEHDGLLTNLVAVAGGSEARSAVDRLRQEAGGAFAEMRATVEEFTGRAQRKTEEERVKAALGRPVTRVILDPQDRVILNTGEIITHQAIERSRLAGVLDILLDSVSTREPEFGIEHRTAPRPGEAGLHEQSQDQP